MKDIPRRAKWPDQPPHHLGENRALGRRAVVALTVPEVAWIYAGP